jgi:hypothetical protein
VLEGAFLCVVVVCDLVAADLNYLLLLSRSVSVYQGRIRHRHRARAVQMESWTLEEGGFRSGQLVGEKFGGSERFDRDKSLPPS